MIIDDYAQVGPALGQRFPNFALPDATGTVVDLDVWRAGRKGLVVFYRSAGW